MPTTQSRGIKVSTYVEDAVVIVDNEYDCRITVEPGYTDDRDRECLRLMVNVKDKSSEMRLPFSEVLPLARRLIELARGHRVKLLVKRERA
jgi:hypothetical protein